MLIVHSASAQASDVTARARIRDAAIVAFGREGFGATVRTIAGAAGVSAALVLHHFGSKEGLRTACDERVLAFSQVDADLLGATDRPVAPDLLAEITRAEGSGAIVRYLARSVQDGGPFAMALVERMVDQTHAWLADGVRQGTIRATADERARARHLVVQSLGTLVVDLVLHPGEDDDGLVHAYLRRHALAEAELMTHGLLVGTDLLDAVEGWSDD